MWKPIVVERKSYLAKFKEVIQGVEVWLSDFCFVWTECLTIEKLQDRFKESTPLLEIPVNVIISEIHSLIANRNGTVFAVSKQGSKCHFFMSTTLSTAMFRIKFNLLEVDAEVVSKELIIPLSLSLIAMKPKVEELINIVKSKDLELKEHKFQGHVLDNASLCTNSFDDVTFIDELKNRSPFCEKAFNDTFVDQFGSPTNSSSKRSPPLMEPTVNRLERNILRESKIKRRKLVKRIVT